MPTVIPPGAGSDPTSAINTAVGAHESDTTNVHGIADTSALVLTDDARLADSRAPNGSAGGDLSGTYPNPAIAAGVIVNADVNAAAAIAESKLSLASDAAAGTASRRTLGTSGTSACAGNDSRLSDSRAPNGTAAGALAGSYPNPGSILTARLLAPIDPRLFASNTAFVSNRLRLVRVVVPMDGFVRDVSWWVGTQSGNIELVVYDVGLATSATYTRLWRSGSTACGAATAWQTIDPGAGTVPVTAGQHLLLGVVADNSTAQHGRYAAVASLTNKLPANFLGAVGGMTNQFLAGFVNTAFPPPSTIADGGVTDENNTAAVIARISPT